MHLVSQTELTALPYRPAFPENRWELGIGIVGCGQVAKKWHLTAYRKYNLKVAGVYDISPAAREALRKQYDGLRVFQSLDELLSDPEVQIVDVATRPPDRLGVIRQALKHGKHILAQKPVAMSSEDAKLISKEAVECDVRVAVNQNGRWAPPWRLAHLLTEAGAVGDVQCVTHLYDTRMIWKPNPRHGSEHFLIFDYSSHWIDITRCWLQHKKITSIRAQEYRTPVQLEEGQVSQAMWISMEYEDGTSALIRGVACASSHGGHPFWIHGSNGTIRGSVDDRSGDYIELENEGGRIRYEIEGKWFPDGFAGAMGELMLAIVENREPSNSISNNLLTLEMLFGACRSVEEGGAVVLL